MSLTETRLCKCDDEIEIVTENLFFLNLVMKKVYKF